MEVSGVPLEQKKWFSLSQFFCFVFFSHSFFFFNEINLFHKRIPKREG